MTVKLIFALNVAQYRPSTEGRARACGGSDDVSIHVGGPVGGHSAALPWDRHICASTTLCSRGRRIVLRVLPMEISEDGG